MNIVTIYIILSVLVLTKTIYGSICLIRKDIKGLRSRNDKR